MKTGKVTRRILKRIKVGTTKPPRRAVPKLRTPRVSPRVRI